MGYTEVGIRIDPIDGEILYAKGERRKGGAYIARITDVDPVYRYKREFLGEKRGTDIKGVVEVFVRVGELNVPELLEIRAGGSWKNDYRYFYVLTKEQLRKIDERELKQLLSEKLTKKEG